MKKSAVFRGAAISSMILALGALAPAAALAWDPATHAYVEERLHKRQGLADASVLRERIYGSYMVDVFNNTFTQPYESFREYLHDIAQPNFLKIWDVAGAGDQKAFAYGFVSHNNTWGMDSTAHVSGMTYGRGEGYVIAKARVLGEMLRPGLENSGLFLGDDALLGVCHYLVESGVDFLVRELDPSIGDKIAAAAYGRSPEIPGLLVEAFAGDLAALAGGEEVGPMIAESEARSRAYLMGYGWALTQPNALQLVAGGLARQGAAYLVSQGYPALPVEALQPVAEQGIVAAMSLCAADFEGEIRATTGWVNGRLSQEGILW